MGAIKKLSEILNWDERDLRASLNGDDITIGDIRELLDWAADHPSEAHQLSEELGR